MRKILLLLLFPMIVFAQGNVDSIIGQLESLSEMSIDNWKYSTNFSYTIDEMSSLSFDDTGWKELKLSEKIYPDSCWLRKVVVLPGFIGGEKVGGKLKLLFTVDDNGTFFVNGVNKGYFAWTGECELTGNAAQGQKLVLLIKVGNTGGPLRLLRAQIDFVDELPTRKLVGNIILSLKTAKKLLSFDTYQTNARVKVDPGTDKSKIAKDEKIKLQNLLEESAAKLNVAGLKDGNVVAFKNSTQQFFKDVKPISDFAKRFTLQFTANAHIDAAWLWRKKETVEVCNKTFSSVMRMFEERPDFTFAQSQAVYYDWMQKWYPDLFKEIKQRYNEGRWEIVGGMWIEPDCNLISGESWSHQLLYAQKYFEENFGKKATIGWNPDSFGYNWNMPQFFLNAGIDAFITQKIGWNDTNVFPYRVFWWESPNGQKILTYFPFDYVDDISNSYKFIDQLRQYEANTGFTKMMVLFGVGDHGGGPSLEMMDNIDKLRDVAIYPNIEFSTANNYLSWLKQQDLSGVPTWDNELYLEYHQGTFTTQAKIKEWNRKNEALLTNAEKLNALNWLFGPTNMKGKIDEAWKAVLFNQFHDILPGSHIREVQVDADKDYQGAFKLGSYVVEKSILNIGKRINTAMCKNGLPIIVFNSLAWERTDLAKVAMPYADEKSYEIYDFSGIKITSQIVSISEYEKEIIFIADKIPSMGYKVYELRQIQSPQRDSVNASFDKTKSSIENDIFRVEIDSDSGWVKSILDKRNQRELLAACGNKIQLLEDKPSAWDAWNIGLTGVEYPSVFRKAEIVEDGSVRTVIRLHRDYLKPGVVKDYPTEYFPSSFSTQDIILYKGLDRIDFRTDVDWWEDHTMLKTSFPLSFSDTVATFDIPYGTIRRSTTMKAQWDKGKIEVPALKWADMTKDNYGVSLLTRSKYGFDIKNNVMRLSLLRSPKWPDPTADRGYHSIEYALYPHTGNCYDGGTIQKAYEYNTSLLTSVTDPHTGALEPTQSFISIEPKNVIVTTLKQSYESDSVWIIQLYEAYGKDTWITITLPFAPVKGFISNFMEEDVEEFNILGKVIRLQIPANSVRAFKLYFK
ncbi:MAG: glycoside hydrolase family 38 C-terminal domain-containing protein [bacterium]